MESNQMKMREALVKLFNDIKFLSKTHNDDLPEDVCAILGRMAFEANEALSAPQHKCRWENGTTYEYEYAYCSECGHMQWAGWDSHREAEDNIEEFAHNYKFCPSCGAKMEGGVYVK